MAVDFQQVQQQVKQLGENAPLRARHLQEKREEARQILQDYAEKGEALRRKIDAAVQANANLRCALPTDEHLDHHAPCPEMPEQIALLAADGSQINPSRHASVDFCLVNVGAILMQHGLADSPPTTVQSQLLYDDQMYAGGGRITERMVALQRDLSERTLLAQLAEEVDPPLITLTDGPLELWVGREGAPEAKAYQDAFRDYLGALRQLHSLGASTAGYIDKPRGDLLVRLLEIATLPQDQIDKAGREYRPYLGITDANLFADLLGPGERSALFGIQSRNANQYTADLALHFFYLNVSRDEKHPYTVRVEIPAWVAEDAAMLNHLHAALMHQSKILGSRPYPYILHRSHEVAVVTQDERAQIENMIALELRRRGLSVGERSHKQSTKDLPGRTQY